MTKEENELVEEYKKTIKMAKEEIESYKEKCKSVTDWAKTCEALAEEYRKTLEETKKTLAARTEILELTKEKLETEETAKATQGRKFIVATKYRAGENAKIIVFPDTIQAIEEATDENGQNYAYIYMSQVGIAVEETIAEIMQKIKKAGAI